MERSKKTRLGLWLITAPALAFLLLETRGAYGHWSEMSGIWDKHAMFHAVTGLFYAQVICISVMVLTWIPLKAGEKWSWWVVALMGIGIHGGHIIADQLTDRGLSGVQAGGGAGSTFFIGTMVALGFYVVGLILTRSHLSDHTT